MRRFLIGLIVYLLAVLVELWLPAEPRFDAPLVLAVGVISLLLVAVLLRYTRIWTVIGYGFLLAAWGMGLLALDSSLHYYHWLPLGKGYFSVANDLIRAAWIVGYAELLVGIVDRVRHGQAPEDGTAPPGVYSD